MLFYIKENPDNLCKTSEFINTSTYENMPGQRLSFFRMVQRKFISKRRFKTMQMGLNNGFCEMSQDEVMAVEGRFNV